MLKTYRIRKLPFVNSLREMLVLTANFLKTMLLKAIINYYCSNNLAYEPLTLVHLSGENLVKTAEQ